MCGVFGVLDSSCSASEKKQLVCNAVAQLAHRGPDEWGYYLTEGIGLGHARLSIVDLAHGQQPMQNERFVISFNGEIFNHIELRAELENLGCRFQTSSDTEVILQAFEQYGCQCFSRFNGQFAILLWDKREKVLTVARDRFGIRPLYVATISGKLVFSSELKAIDCVPGYRREIDTKHLLEHGLFWNTLNTDTIYKNVRSVESGTFERYRIDGSVETQRYYQIGEGLTEPLKIDFDEAQQQFKALMSDSVALRLRSDVPVGAYLSGGIDSTVIAHIVNQQTNHPFRTFSVGFKDETLDESYYQQLASKEFNSIHHAVDISYDDIAQNLLNTVFHTERPIFRTAPVPLHLLSQAVQQSDIKVVLTGEGADEILFGYDAFKEVKLLEAWKKTGDEHAASEQIRKLYPHLAHYADSRQFGLMKLYYEGFLDDIENEFVGLNVRMSNNKVIQNYLNKDLAVEFNKEDLLAKLKQSLPENYNHWSLLQKNSFLEIKTLMQGYLLSSQGDRMALSHGVEGRFPFLDHRVVDFCFSLPDSFKLKHFDQKHILKKAYQDFIPEEIVNRPKRPYMAPDLIAFFSKEGKMADIAQSLLSESCIGEFGIFDNRITQRFLRKFSNGVSKETGYRDNMIFIFLLTTQMCEYWIRNREQRTPNYDRCTISIEE